MTPHETCPEINSPTSKNVVSRRHFLSSSVVLAAGLAAGCKTGPAEAETKEPIIDIHQHLNYSGRTNDVFLEHQRKMGITKTILLPAGRPVITASTLEDNRIGTVGQPIRNVEVRDTSSPSDPARLRRFLSVRVER